jgi:hypothetical protein
MTKTMTIYRLRWRKTSNARTRYYTRRPWAAKAQAKYEEKGYTTTLDQMIVQPLTGWLDCETAEIVPARRGSLPSALPGVLCTVQAVVDVGDDRHRATIQPDGSAETYDLFVEADEEVPAVGETVRCVIEVLSHYTSVERVA